MKHTGYSNVNKYLISELPIKSFGTINFTYSSNGGNLSHVPPVSENEKAVICLLLFDVYILNTQK